MPNRGNIEIEIYGMEGIPPEDVKEHDRLKAGGAGNDKPTIRCQQSQPDQNVHLIGGLRASATFSLVGGKTLHESRSMLEALSLTQSIVCACTPPNIGFLNMGRCM